MTRTKLLSLAASVCVAAASAAAAAAAASPLEGNVSAPATQPAATTRSARWEFSAPSVPLKIYTMAPRPPEKGPFLGVSASPAPAVVRDQLKLPPGVGLVVDHLVDASPAAAAGLRKNDVLQRLDDQLLINPEQLAVLVRTHKPGDEVKLSIIREAQPQVLTAKIIEHDVAPLAVTFDPAPPLQFILTDPRAPAVFTPSRRGGLTFSDSQHTLSIVQTGSGRRLVALDAATGKVLFDGPIDTPEERGKVPPGIWDKVKELVIEGPGEWPATNQAMKAREAAEAARRAVSPQPPRHFSPMQATPAPAPDAPPGSVDSAPANPPS